MLMMSMLTHGVLICTRICSTCFGTLDVPTALSSVPSTIDRVDLFSSTGKAFHWLEADANDAENPSPILTSPKMLSNFLTSAFKFNR